ncbi:hypothetical protein J4463_03980 [Candidatus Pacearchaeota archaeon]|nr:hypothetical protein [Candidatus Pacearchaeota archaeon]
MKASGKNNPMVATQSNSKKMSRDDLDQLIVENFVTLQKVLTNLAGKFDNLSEQISKLLSLFEISAKSFAEKYSEGGASKEDKEFLDKLNKLLDQNKLIAKGLTMMEERVRERIKTDISPASQQPPQFRPAPMFPQNRINQDIVQPGMMKSKQLSEI